MLRFCARPQSECAVNVRHAQESILRGVQTIAFQRANLSGSLGPQALFALYNPRRTGTTRAGFTREWDRGSSGLAHVIQPLPLFRIVGNLVLLEGDAVHGAHHLLRKWWQSVHGLCRLERADLHESPVQACERPVSRKRLRANHA